MATSFRTNRRTRQAFPLGNTMRNKVRKENRAFRKIESKIADRKLLPAIKKEALETGGFDAKLIPQSTPGRNLVSFAQKRSPCWFFFDVDNIAHTPKAARFVLAKLIQLSSAKFSEFEIRKTQHGYHLIAKIPSCSTSKDHSHDAESVLKYHDFFNRFLKSDYWRPRGQPQSLRITPKYNIYTGSVDSPSPKVVYSNLKSEPRGSIRVTRVRD